MHLYSSRSPDDVELRAKAAERECKDLANPICLFERCSLAARNSAFPERWSRQVLSECGHNQSHPESSYSRKIHTIQSHCLLVEARSQYREFQRRFKGFRP